MANTFSPCTLGWAAAIGAALMSGGGVARADGPAGMEPAVLRVAATKPSKGLRVEHVDAEGAAKALSANTNIIVLDVRTPREFRSGRISGATNIDFNGNGFSAALEKLERDRTYLVHCAGGGRSTKALEVFRKLRFKSVIHLDGGIGSWEKAGKPMVK